jgi:hypothetical protein
LPLGDPAKIKDQVVMAKDDVTDAEISLLLGMPKRILNPTAKSKTEGWHERTDYKVESLDGNHEFALFTRQTRRV